MNFYKRIDHAITIFGIVVLNVLDVVFFSSGFEGPKFNILLGW